MDYEESRKSDSRFKALTSLRIAEFDYLLPEFEKELRFRFRRTFQGKIRVNKLSWCKELPSAGHHLFFLLTYLKSNPTQEYHGAVFNLSQQYAGKLIKDCLLAFNEASKKLKLQPCENGAEFPAYVESLKRHYEKLSVNLHTNDLLMDCTEVRTERSTDEEVQSDFYSGKKKSHTVKNLIISLFCGFVTFVSPGFCGSVHDKKMADEAALSFPDQSYLWVDSGFEGYDNSQTNIVRPFKKTKGKKLTINQLDHNYTISQFRVVNEHAIGGIKRCRVLKDTIRHRQDKLSNHFFMACSSLHNLRVLARKHQLLS